MQVFPCNMADIFCTFRGCNVCNSVLFFFFTKWSSVIFVYIICCFVACNSSGN